MHGLPDVTAASTIDSSGFPDQIVGHTGTGLSFVGFVGEQVLTVVPRGRICERFVECAGGRGR